MKTLIIKILFIALFINIIFAQDRSSLGSFAPLPHEVILEVMIQHLQSPEISSIIHPMHEPAISKNIKQYMFLNKFFYGLVKDELATITFINALKNTFKYSEKEAAYVLNTPGAGTYLQKHLKKSGEYELFKQFQILANELRQDIPSIRFEMKYAETGLPWGKLDISMLKGDEVNLKICKKLIKLNKNTLVASTRAYINAAIWKLLCVMYTNEEKKPLVPIHHRLTSMHELADWSIKHIMGQRPHLLHEGILISSREFNIINHIHVYSSSAHNLECNFNSNMTTSLSPAWYKDDNYSPSIYKPLYQSFIHQTMQAGWTMIDDSSFKGSYQIEKPIEVKKAPEIIFLFNQLIEELGLKKLIQKRTLAGNDCPLLTCSIKKEDFEEVVNIFGFEIENFNKK